MPELRHENAGSFCPACGQKRIHPGDLGLRHAWHHVLHEVGHVDGKLLNSLKLLFTRPGQLTIDFIEGRRARHVHPIQLFLLFGLAFFLLAQVDSPLDMRSSMEINPAAKPAWENIAGKRGLTLDQLLDLHRTRMNAVFKTVDNRRHPAPWLLALGLVSEAPALSGGEHGHRACTWPASRWPCGWRQAGFTCWA